METPNRSVAVDCQDLYQLLIAECRYGYTRNNHLMPDGAFSHCKEYLPLMAQQDVESALCTARQLAEEAISELCRDALYDVRKQFYFVVEQGRSVSSVSSEWIADLYLFGISKTFKALEGTRISAPDGTTYASLTRSPYHEGKLCVEFLGFDEDPYDYDFEIYKPNPEKPDFYSSLPKQSRDVVEVDEGQTLLLSVRRSQQTLDVKSYVGFIDYCLDFNKKWGSENYRGPYNSELYKKFLETHPKP